MTETQGYQTSYLGMFEDAQDGRPRVTAIEIPIIQRDFAQGRTDGTTSTIRHRFLGALIEAASGGARVGLDFVYGELDQRNVFRPLDGQQRLTTLFLLHWYVASKASKLNVGSPWLRLTYATRPSAQHFCEALAEHPLPPSGEDPVSWVTDQPWYLYTWHNDPSVQAMLVMLREIHMQFADTGVEFPEVWDRLCDAQDPVIWFLLLTVDDHGRGEDLYIKMNSRGKPLTQFEVVKAGLEGVLEGVLSEERLTQLKDRFDNAWTDLFWEYERRNGGDMVVDLEFERYLTFLMDVFDWRMGEAAREAPIEERAARSLAHPNDAVVRRNLDFLFHALDTWHYDEPERARRDFPGDVFAQYFGPNDESDTRIPLFSPRSTDLFETCIGAYGTDGFSLAETFLLLAVLLTRENDALVSTQSNSRRLRSLRNLAESAFLDRKRIPDMVRSVENLMLKGSLSGAQGFNAEWARDEERKWKVLDAEPDVTQWVHLLEDQTVLRGRLLSFDITDDRFPARARSFASISSLDHRDSFGAALLTKGDYSRQIDSHRRQLGNATKDDSWRDLLTTPSAESESTLRSALASLLDDVAQRATDEQGPPESLRSISEEWLAEREKEGLFDWRYYLVRYGAARSSKGEGFFHGQQYDAAKGGFSLGRLRILHGFNYQSRFTDAILKAIWTEGEFASDIEEPTWWRREDPGMRFRRSRLELRNVDWGFELLPPPELVDKINAFMSERPGVVELLDVPGVEEGGRWRDSRDRVIAGVELVKRLLAAGF